MTTTTRRFGRRLRKAVRRRVGRVTGARRVLPEFIVIGTQRGGTTGLFRYLRKHPQVGGSSKKEVHYFDVNYERGESWYRGHFPTRAERRHVHTTGESTPNYLFHPQVPERVKALVPDAKFVVLLRNPADRAHSAWRLQTAIGHETLPFEAALDAEESRLAPDLARVERGEAFPAWDLLRFSYLARGRYAEQLERWFDIFPRERFLILRSEDFFADPVSGYDRTADFLGLDRWHPGTPGAVNRVEGSDLDAATRQRLIEYFEPHNRRLAELLGRDLEWD